MLKTNAPSQRREFFFYNENSLNAFRVDDWKVHLKTKTVWIAPVEQWPLGMLINIKADPALARYSRLVFMDERENLGVT